MENRERQSDRSGRGRAEGARARPCAFSLIELLVVIAIVALLVALLLPAIGKARREGQRVRELATANQLMVAYHAYADDNRGWVLPAKVPQAMIEQGIPAPGPTIRVPDQNGRLVEPTGAARYPWRIAPYVGPYDFRAMILDREMYDDYTSRQDRPYTGDFTSRQHCYSNNPSLGINSMFLGIDKRIYRDPGHAPPSWWPRWPWIQRVDQVDFTDRLLVFASARGPRMDVPSGDPSEVARNGPGFYEVLPPRNLDHAIAYDDPGMAWDEHADAWDFGFLDLRYSGRAVAAMFDCHAEMLGLTAGTRDGFRDMRRWSDDATRADWSWYP